MLVGHRVSVGLIRSIINPKLPFYFPVMVTCMGGYTHDIVLDGKSYRQGEATDHKPTEDTNVRVTYVGRQTEPFRRLGEVPRRSSWAINFFALCLSNHNNREYHLTVRLLKVSFV